MYIDYIISETLSHFTNHNNSVNNSQIGKFLQSPVTIAENKTLVTHQVHGKNIHRALLSPKPIVL